MAENSNYVSKLEELYRTTHYKALYKGKELYFEIETHQVVPVPAARILKYDGVDSIDLPNELIRELTDAINEIEDLGLAKLL